MVVSESAGAGWQEMKSFFIHLLAGRWFMAFAAVLIMSVSGSGYLFGLYSNDIKTSLGYDQTTLNLLGFFKDLGGNVGVLSGLLLEITPPWVVLSIGAVMNLSGYTMIWLAVTGRIAKPAVWHMCIYIYVGANSQAFANTGAMVTSVKNFPESRGAVLGLMKGFVGLSGAIMTQLYHAIYGDNSKALILFIAWLPAAVSFIFLRTVRILKVIRQTNELKIFYRFLYISLGLAGLLMILIIIQNKYRFSKTENAGSACLELVLIFLPILVVANEEFKLWKIKKQKSLNNPISQVKIVTETPALPENQETEQVASKKPETPTLPENQETEQVVSKKPVSCLSGAFSPPERGEDYTILQALFSVDMLILFIAVTCGIGGTLTAIDNLGQIGHALGYPARSTTTFVSLVSIWNYLGRAVAGFASEYLLKYHKCPRPLLFTIMLLFSCIGHLLIAFAVPNSLYFASVIIGFCFGTQWPLMYAIISEIFGLKYYSTLYNFGTVASPIGAYVLNVRVAGPLYDKEAMRQLRAAGRARKAGEDLTCAGPECYRVAFLIVTAATFLGFLVSIVLVVRTRKFYGGDIYKRYREEVEDAEIGMAESTGSGVVVVPLGDREDTGTVVADERTR